MYTCNYSPAFPPKLVFLVINAFHFNLNKITISNDSILMCLKLFNVFFISSQPELHVMVKMMEWMGEWNG